MYIELVLAITITFFFLIKNTKKFRKKLYFEQNKYICIKNKNQ